ncbi:tol-pal system YbgF family protein [Bacteroidota bacterium]
MKRVLIFLFIVTVISIMDSCIATAEKAIEEILEIEKELALDSTGVIIPEKADRATQLYRHFVEKFPNHPNSPMYLFHGADLAMNTGNYEMAIDMLNTLIESYPESDKVPVAMHLRGFIYEDKLIDLDKAKASYQELIDKFPKHELAENAQGCIDNLGISPEELIKMWAKRDSLTIDSAKLSDSNENLD